MAGTATTTNEPWPDIVFAEDADDLLHSKGTGWDTTLDAHIDKPTTSNSTITDTVSTKVGDSTEIHHTKPLYEVVADHIDSWKAIGTSVVIQEWIEKGVYFKLDKQPPNFFHKQLPHAPEALTYWRTKLLPHYLASGAIK